MQIVIFSAQRLESINKTGGKMKTFNLIVILALCSFVFACGTASNTQTANTATPANAAKPANAATPASTANSSDTAAAVGVPACDEYLAEVDKFVENPKVPQATKDMYRKQMDQNRDMWKQAASTPQGKAGLETACKAALDGAKKAFEAFK
jgi:hypothetical protein